MIEAVLADLSEVVLSDPGVPMVRESGRCSVFAKSLGVGVLIDHCHARGPRLKDGGSNPWLEDKPAAEAHTSDFIIVVVEGYITLAEAAVYRSKKCLGKGLVERLTW